MALVASSAAAADTTPQAPAPGTRRRPMRQAERALPAAARTWGALRCGATRGTLRAGARGGRRAYGSTGGPPSRGRGK